MGNVAARSKIWGAKARFNNSSFRLMDSLILNIQEGSLTCSLLKVAL